MTGELSIAVDLDGDTGYLDALVSGLRDDLLLLDVAAVEPLRVKPPPGAKSDVGLAVGAFAVSGALSASVLNAIAKVAVAWLERTRARSVTLERCGERLVLQGLRSPEQRALVDEWLARQTAGDCSGAELPRS